jgi:hypothetical protein
MAHVRLQFQWHGDGKPMAKYNVELSGADVGLIFALLLDDLLKDHEGQSYEIITTGEVATTPDLLTKFGNIITMGADVRREK